MSWMLRLYNVTCSGCTGQKKGKEAPPVQCLFQIKQFDSTNQCQKEAPSRYSVQTVIRRERTHPILNTTRWLYLEQARSPRGSVNRRRTVFHFAWLPHLPSLILFEIYAYLERRDHREAPSFIGVQFFILRDCQNCLSPFLNTIWDIRLRHLYR